MPRGGYRQGAGRPIGSGKYGETTTVIRIPSSEVSNVMEWIQHRFHRLPFYQYPVAAGFPSPAEDELAEKLDLNKLLIKHPTATFFLRVSGSSMIKAGIHPNDILVVDRSIEPVHGKIVIASINGDLTVKRLYRNNNKVRLVPENDAYPSIEISEESDLRIWGVVTSVIHAL